MKFVYPTDAGVLLLNYVLICAVSYLLSLYIFCKSQSIKLSGRKIIYVILSGTLITAAFTALRFFSIPLSHLFRFVFIPVSLSFLPEKREHFLRYTAIGLISLSLESVFEYIAMILHSVFFVITGFVAPGILSYVISELLTAGLCVGFMNIKRLRKGLQFFENEKHLGLGLLISGVLLVLKCVNLRENLEINLYHIIFFVGGLVSSFGLYLWISRSITAHYRERLQLKSEEHFREILKEKERENKTLNQTNEYLAKVVHRDNHLINSLNSSIDAYFASGDEKFKDELLREIQTLARERGELIENEQRDSKLMPSTGNHMIDRAVNDLYIKAAAHGIDFNLTVSALVDEVIGKYISQTELQTLLCDHIKDAVIAVDAAGKRNGRILVDLSDKNGSYCVTVFDSGVDFEPDTLAKLGRERVTTHADNGGSGSGFMTTFETLRKAAASLIITEFENKTPFSKSVCFRFDGESAFIIQSYRKEELKAAVGRDDVVLL